MYIICRSVNVVEDIKFIQYTMNVSNLLHRQQQSSKSAVLNKLHTICINKSRGGHTPVPIKFSDFQVARAMSLSMHYRYKYKYITSNHCFTCIISTTAIFLHKSLHSKRSEIIVSY